MIRRIRSGNAPAAIGPYSQALTAGAFVFVSGQIPLEPDSGKLVAGGIRRQTEQAIKNIEGILGSAGCRLENVVRTEVFLADLGDFDEMNEAYGAFFPVEAQPARYVVQAAALPKGAKIEIACVAYNEAC